MIIYSVIKAILRTIIILLNNLYAIPTYLLWMLTLRPLRAYNPQLYNRLEGIGYSWLLHMVSFWSWSSGYIVVEAGDDVSDLIDKECLVIGNHQSTADVPVLMYYCSNSSKPGLARNLYWIMDILFKYTNFGWVATMHGDFFIRQGRDTRQSQLADLRDHLRQVYIPNDRKWILLFPEGGFLRKRKDASQDYGRKHGYPVLEHVTLPRVGAMITLMNTLSSPASSNSSNGDNGVTSYVNDTTESTMKRKCLKWIIDITVGYPNGKPLDLFCIIFGNCEPCKTTLYFRRYNIADVPCTEKELLAWMYDRWAEKDKLLAHFYETGKFPESPTVDGAKKDGNCHDLQMSWAWCCFLHVLFCLSTYIHANILYNIISCIITTFV